MNALEIQHLSKHFPGFSLEDVSLTLPAGCILGLIGENGAGKSTLIHLILGMLRRDGGSVRILGRTGEALEVTKQDLGVVLDEVGIPGCLNAAQVGRIMARTYRNWQPKTYDDLLDRLEVPRKKRFQDFSRGMKMKLGIAVALSHEAKLLILDEATNGLDPVVRDQVLDLLTQFTRDPGHAVLISSHIVSDLEKLCDYVAFLHKGKLLVLEEKDLLLSRYGIFRGTPAQAEALPASAVVHRKETPYGVEALVLRQEAPAAVTLGSVGVEDLFITLAKEAN